MHERLQTSASLEPILNMITACDLMTPNPVSLRAGATLPEAVAFFTDRGFSAAPVIDEAGRPVGVLSRADILVHEHERPGLRRAVPDYYGRNNADVASAEEFVSGYGGARGESMRVRDIMTPVVFSVAPQDTAWRVIGDLVGLKVHRLFVVGDDGVLIGVISALDVLKYLRTE
jgi:CBS domain-containing protein